MTDLEWKFNNCSANLAAVERGTGEREREAIRKLSLIMLICMTPV